MPSISIQTILQNNLPLGYTGSRGFTGSRGDGGMYYWDESAANWVAAESGE